MWLPLGIVMVKMVFHRGKTTALERFAIGLGVWVVLHAGALAYGRGAGGARPETRYMDFLSMGVVANSMALVAMLDGGRADAMRRDVSCGCPWSPGSFFAGGGAVRLADRSSTSSTLGSGSFWRMSPTFIGSS